MFSHVQLVVTPWNSPGIPEWVAIPYPGDLPDPGIKPRSPALQVDSLPAEQPDKPLIMLYIFNYYLLERGQNKVVDCRALRKEEIDGKKKKITKEKLQNLLNRKQERDWAT